MSNSSSEVVGAAYHEAGHVLVALRYGLDVGLIVVRENGDGGTNIGRTEHLPTPIFTLSPEAARNVLAGAQKSVSVTLAPARSDDRIFNVGPKGRTDIRIYRPENATARCRG